MSLSTTGAHRFEHRANNAVAFLVSLIFHVSLLLLLACWVYTAGKPSQGVLLSAEMGESTDTSFELLRDFELESPAPADSPAEAKQPELEIEIDLDQVLVPEVELKTGSAELAAALASVSVGDVVRELGGPARGRGANFFGAYAEGNRFIYVLDSSRSMTGDRWVYACNQLIDSLKGLRRGQEFFVICFDLHPSLLFNAAPDGIEFFESDDETVARVRRWLRSRQLGNATMPAEALKFALNLNPDAVFLLSDGELQDNTLGMLRRVNSSLRGSNIPIHTVHLFSASGQATLRQIADENRGSFTPISSGRW